MVVRAAEPAFLVVILFLEFCINVDIKQNSEEAGVGLGEGLINLSSYRSREV